MKKVKKIFKNENEIKLGKIYTTLGQRKHIKYKTKSMHKENPININNKKDNFSEKGSTWGGRRENGRITWENWRRKRKGRRKI